MWKRHQGVLSVRDKRWWLETIFYHLRVPLCGLMYIQMLCKEHLERNVVGGKWMDSVCETLLDLSCIVLLQWSYKVSLKWNNDKIDTSVFLGNSKWCRKTTKIKELWLPRVIRICFIFFWYCLVLRRCWFWQLRYRSLVNMFYCIIILITNTLLYFVYYMLCNLMKFSLDIYLTSCEIESLLDLNVEVI